MISFVPRVLFLQRLCFTSQQDVHAFCSWRTFNSDFDSKNPERNITNKDANALQVMRCGALRCEGRRAACWGWRAKTPGRPHQRPGPARSGRWRRGPPPHPGTRRRQRPLHRQTVAVLPSARGQRLMSMTSSVSRISFL